MTIVLEGKEAEKFRKDMRRIESLHHDNPEYIRRKKFFDECREMGNKVKIKR